MVKDSGAKPFIEQKDVILCRSGIQLYHKSEVAGFITEDNKPAVEREWYREYRPANVVVKAQDLFKSLPVTKEHPSEWVTPDNWRELTGGVLDREVSVVSLEGESEGEIGLKSNITFFTEDLYNYYLQYKEVSVGYECKKHFVDNPDEVGYDIILDEIVEVNHLAITKAGRGGSSVAVIDSIIGGIRPMRTGIFAYLKSKMQKDSAPSFGKTVLDSVKNSKGTTEEELAVEMKGVLDSMSILKDCEAKAKLVEVVKDCFDNKEMAIENEAELTATLDSMWIDIHGDSLSEIAKAFSKLAKTENKETASAVKDSDKEDEESSEKKSDEEDKKNEDSEKKSDKEDEKEEKTEDSDKKSEEEEKGKEKDGCSKDSLPVSKEEVAKAVMDSLSSEIKAMVTDAVKEVLGLKGSDKASVEGMELDSINKGDEAGSRDYASFLE